jgi:predicted LPLAT superfamily acyltransferase
VEGAIARYAERLEHYARSAPDNWFNFHDFWGTR